jgi:hypothetical protein
MIEFKPVIIDEDYRKKWNIHNRDFIQLYKDGVKISDTFYRIGGIGGDWTDGYIMLLKYVEAYYDDVVTKDKKQKPHLENQWCILNEDGIEKVNFNRFEDPYLKGGVIYSCGSKYYNIETGEYYGESYNCMHTKDYIFINNAYDKDKTKRGILRIHKFNGAVKLYQ